MRQWAHRIGSMQCILAPPKIVCNRGHLVLDIPFDTVYTWWVLASRLNQMWLGHPHRTPGQPDMPSCWMVLSNRRRACLGLTHAPLLHLSRFCWLSPAIRSSSVECHSSTPPGPSCSCDIESAMMIFAPFLRLASISSRFFACFLLLNHPDCHKSPTRQ